MAQPTFNDDAIFGEAVEMTHDDPPNAAQVNHYPGTLGVERLDLGVMASFTLVQGQLYGLTTDELAAACQVIRTLKQSATRGTLVDTDGAQWPEAIIESFKTSGRATYAPGLGWARHYELRIIHTNYQPPDDGSGDGGTGTGGTGATS